jgi:hypothetical protein
MSAEALPQQEKVRWPGFKYVPVRGLMNRHISRYLRIQRKNMRRFFNERGFSHLAMRLDQIRKSRQGMLAKNRMFQEVLNEYAKAMAPPGAAAVPVPAPEAGDPKDAGSTALDMQPAPDVGARITSGPRDDAGAGISIVGEEDGGGS